MKSNNPRGYNQYKKRSGVVLPTIALGLVLAIAGATMFHWNKTQTWFAQEEIKYEKVVDDRDMQQKVADNAAELSRLLKAQNDHTRELEAQKERLEDMLAETEQLIASSTQEATDLEEEMEEIVWQLTTIAN